MADDRLVIFDCDGVLVDSEALAARALCACLGENGIGISVAEASARYAGFASRDVLADVARRSGRPLPADLPARLAERTRALFATTLQPVPGIAALLAGLTGPRCVASGSNLADIRNALQLTGLAGHFGNALFSAEMVAQGKPAPDVYLLAASRMATRPDRCLAIEDSVPGVQAARAAGMTVFGLTAASHCTPEHGQRLQEAGAEQVFTNCTPLAQTIHARVRCPD